MSYLMPNFESVSENSIFSCRSRGYEAQISRKTGIYLQGMSLLTLLLHIQTRSNTPVRPEEAGND
jgi:hypothetical protein